LQSGISSLRGGGEPLPETFRDFFEPRFTHDFSHVRIHAGLDANRLSAAIRARAFTVGNEIVFGQGEFAPHSSAGRRLLAHELTHVMQQGASTHSGAKQNSNIIQRAALLDDPLCEGQEFPPAEVWFGDPVLARIRSNQSLMSFGSTGEPVALVQQAVVAWGCDEGIGHLLPAFGVDGIFGSETRAAVKTFQGQQGIDADGIVGPITMSELDRFVGELLPACSLGTEAAAIVGESRPAVMQNFCLPPVPPPLPLGKGCPTPGTSGVTGIHKAQQDFTGRSTTRFGVGEACDLSFDSFLSKGSPPDKKAVPHAGLKWVKTSGPGSLGNINSEAGTATFTADQNAGPVELELRVLVGPCAGSAVAEVSFEIIKPIDGVIQQDPDTNLRHTQGTWSVGFLGRAFLRPTDVSFIGINFAEGRTTAKADGFLEDRNGEVHPVGELQAVGPGNITTGSPVRATDEIFSGRKGPPFSKGTFRWEIPWEFSVGGGSFEEFTIANEVMTADAEGTATIEKKGSGEFRRRAQDPTESFT
jgi:hypothetical protein